MCPGPAKIKLTSGTHLPVQGKLGSSSRARPVCCSEDPAQASLAGGTDSTPTRCSEQRRGYQANTQAIFKDTGKGTHRPHPFLHNSHPENNFLEPHLPRSSMEKRQWSGQEAQSPFQHHLLYLWVRWHQEATTRPVAQVVCPSLPPSAPSRVWTGRLSEAKGAVSQEAAEQRGGGPGSSEQSPSPEGSCPTHLEKTPGAQNGKPVKLLPQAGSAPP